MQGPRDIPVPTRLTLVCVAISLLLHTGGVAWFATAGTAASAGGDRAHAPETPVEPPPDEARLGIEEATRATIDWLGFAEPTPHRGAESETDQAALSTAPVGAPEPPASDTPPTPDVPPVPESQPAPESQPVTDAGKPADEPARTEASRREHSESIEQPPASDLPTPPPMPINEAAPVLTNAETVTEPVIEPVIEPGAEPIESDTPRDADEPTQSGTAPSEAQPADKPVEESADKPVEESPEAQDDPQAAANPLPKGVRPGADTVPGIIAERESTPTAKVVNLDVKDWGKPAAGKGIRVNTVRPRFPDTLAIFRRELNASVLIAFGPDGRVKNVEFETIRLKDREKRLDTGSPEADRVLTNSVYNWTAVGDEIDGLKEQGPDARIIIRMQMRVRP